MLYHVYLEVKVLSCTVESWYSSLFLAIEADRSKGKRDCVSFMIWMKWKVSPIVFCAEQFMMISDS